MSVYGSMKKETEPNHYPDKGFFEETYKIDDWEVTSRQGRPGEAARWRWQQA